MHNRTIEEILSDRPLTEAERRVVFPKENRAQARAKARRAELDRRKARDVLNAINAERRKSFEAIDKFEYLLSCCDSIVRCH